MANPQVCPCLIRQTLAPHKRRRRSPITCHHPSHAHHPASCKRLISTHRVLTTQHHHPGSQAACTMVVELECRMQAYSNVLAAPEAVLRRSVATVTPECRGAFLPAESPSDCARLCLNQSCAKWCRRASRSLVSRASPSMAVATTCGNHRKM